MSMNWEMNRDSVKKLTIWGLGLLLLIWIVHQLSKPTTPQIPPVKVSVQKPVVSEIVDYVSQTGTLVAYNSVNLVARVEGYLDKIEFTDGTFVKKGQPLFVIEPQPYLEKLKEAQAQVAAQKADLAYSKSEYARQQRMYKQNATSLNNVESWLAKSEASAAQLDEAIANEAIAQINYGYTHISAPFAGRIGRHLVDIGNLVGNGAATNLATLEQVSPIYAYFNLNELDLIKLRAAARAMGFKPEDLDKIPAYLRLQNETSFAHKGHMDFVNTGLNASTGTLEFRAIFENKDYFLVPGLFVEVRIPVTNPVKMLTVPDTAVLYDQIGPYLLTVDKDSLVQQKRVELGSSEKGQRAIKSGLAANDRVIVQGLQFASPGNKVEAHDL